MSSVTQFHSTVIDSAVTDLSGYPALPALQFTPIAADRIFPATPAIKDAPIATSIVRS